MAAASAQMDAQLLQLTDLVVLLGGLGGLAFVASSGITKECRTKGVYLLCMLAFVFVGSFWCVAQIGARQTGFWSTFVIALGWLFLLRWGTFWVPPGHQIVLKSSLEPMPIVLSGTVLRFYLPFIYRRAPLQPPGLAENQYTEVLCSARVLVKCGPLECASADGMQCTFKQVDVAFTIRDASHWLAPSQARA